MYVCHNIYCSYHYIYIFFFNRGIILQFLQVYVCAHLGLSVPLYILATISLSLNGSIAFWFFSLRQYYFFAFFFCMLTYLSYFLVYTSLLYAIRDHLSILFRNIFLILLIFSYLCKSLCIRFKHMLSRYFYRCHIMFYCHHLTRLIQSQSASYFDLAPFMIVSVLLVVSYPLKLLVKMLSNTYHLVHLGLTLSVTNTILILVIRQPNGQTDYIAIQFMLIYVSTLTTIQRFNHFSYHMQSLP